MRRTSLRDEGGYALMAVIIASAMLLTVGVIGVRSSRMELKISSNELQAQEALAIAEAGLIHAAALINADADGYDDELYDVELGSSSIGISGALVAMGSTVTVNDDSYRFHAFGGSGSSDGYNVRVEDNFDESDASDDPTVDTDEQIKIVSRGQMGNAVRIVEAVLRPTAPGSGPGYGIFGKDHVLLGGNGGYTDSYNSNDGEHCLPADDPLRESGDPACEPEHQNSNGNIGSNGDIDVTSTIPIMGNASAGGAIDLGSGGSVTGDQLEYQDPVAIDPDPVLDCNTNAAAGGAYSDGTGITLDSGSYFGPEGCVEAGTGCTGDDSKKLGEFTQGGGNTASLAPPGTPGVFVDADGYAVYCFKDVSITGGSILEITGPTKIYVTEKFVIGGGGLGNTTLIPNNLHIYSSYGDDGYEKDGVTMTGGSANHAVIHAPTTDVVVGGGGDLYGSVLGFSVELTGGSAVHYDEALGGGSSAAGGAGLLLSHWREVRSF